MTREQIIDTLTPMVREVFDNPAMVIEPDMGPDPVDGWTSLAFMQLLAKVEEAFGVKFKIFELVGIRTLGDLMAAIEKHC